ncbi:hypothetical protein B0H14DRAFT_2557208 [Mycena olivaceomarginata]|nr:hypothetical protein B0H14DRAFT_2557208 [Mycena olivaceomarginata]
MDSTNPALTIDASAIPKREASNNSFDLSAYYDPSVTPGGYFDNSVTSGSHSNNPVTSGGYSDDSVPPGGHPDNSVTAGGYPDHSVTPSGHPVDAGAASGYPATAFAADGQRVDVAALIASNNDLNALLHNMCIGYNNQAQTEMAAFRAALHDDFIAVQNQRDTARAENQELSTQIAPTIARLECLERTPPAPEHTHERPHDPRVRPPPSKAQQTMAQSTTQPPATPAQKSQPSSTPRHSPTPKDSTPGPASKPSRGSSDKSRGSRTPPRPSSSPRGSSSKSPRGSSSSASSSSKAQSGTQDGGSRKKAKTGTPRKLAEHQMLKGDIDNEAQSFKTTFQTHIRFLWGCLDSASAPSSASADVVARFELRFEGATVAELKRMGQYGHPVINPSQVKVGVNVTEALRSKNRILRAFCHLEESAILHVKAYLAKLGINIWAVALTQSPYSMYNSAMRMCAIDTFRFLIAGMYYDFLHPDTRFVKDSALLLRLYDHFVHRYMYDKWKVDIRTPGGNELAAEQNKISQARIRLHASRMAYLKDAAIPKRLKLMFSPKATSDDESTSNGPQALAREERSQAADQVIRAVDRLIVQDLLQDGKKRSANNRSRHRVPAFGEHNAGHFQEIPKGMPIQYYDPTWFNNQPPHARAKFEAKLVVALVPGSTDFFSRRGDNTLSIEELTAKYGETVFGNYDLDFGKEREDESSDTDDEGEGDSIGSQDSDEEEAAEQSNAASMASFLSDDASDGEEEYDPAATAEEAASDGDFRAAEFAAAYDVDMEQEIFGDSDDSDDSV